MNMQKETYYWTCPHCGANLDPGESCDCHKENPEQTEVDNYKAVQGGDNRNVNESEK